MMMDGVDWAERRAARDRGERGCDPAFADWLADPDAADRRTHPDDPDGSRAEGSALAAAIAMRARDRARWRRIR